MTLALVQFNARTLQIGSVSRKRGVQQVYMKITGANTDVAVDIGTNAGTFWTAAIADATYGAMATQALSTLQNIIAQSVGLVGLKSQEVIWAQLRVAAGSEAAGAYSMAISNSRPNFTFAAANAPTLHNLILEYELNDGIFPVTVG